MQGEGECLVRIRVMVSADQTVAKKYFFSLKERYEL